MARVIAPWEGRQPFADDSARRPVLIRKESFVLTSGGLSDDERHGPCLCRVIASTPRIGFVCLMYLAPGEYFPSGNHPNVETYLHLEGVLHLVNPDSGQVLEIQPGDAAVIPPMQFHTGYNLGPGPTVTLACVPGRAQTPEFDADPDRSHHHSHGDLQPFWGPSAYPGFPTALRQLGDFPGAGDLAATTAWQGANRRLAPPDWLRFVHGPKGSPAIVSVYHASRSLLAGTIKLGVTGLTRSFTFPGEAVMYALSGPVALNFAGGIHESIWIEPGNGAYVPEATEFQIQSIAEVPGQVAFFVSPWTPSHDLSDGAHVRDPDRPVP